MGHDLTTIEHGHYQTCNTRHVGARLGGGFAEHFLSLASHIPSTTHLATTFLFLAVYEAPPFSILPMQQMNDLNMLQHAEEVCLGQGLDIHLVQEQVVECGCATYQSPKGVEAPTIPRHDHKKVIH